MTLEDALEEVKEEYSNAVNQEWITNPLAYSLYKVWERADRKAKRRKSHER